MQPSTRPNMTSTSRLQFVLHSYLQKSITDASIYSNPKKMVVRKKQTYFNGKSSSDNVLRTQKCSGVKPVKVYRLQNHSAFRGKFKAKHRSFSYSSGGGLEGATNWSRSIPSAIRVAAAMKVSMKDWKSCFLVLATLRDANLSSRASLQ